MALDDYDRTILAKLMEHATATQAELGEVANLSGPAAGRRQRLLEKNGYIRGYNASFDFDRFGYGMLVMVLIKLEKQSTDTLERFEKAVTESPSILSCHLLSGSEDYLIILRARDLADYQRIHRAELSKLPGVTTMQSLFSLREVVSRTAPKSMFDARNGEKSA